MEKIRNSFKVLKTKKLYQSFERKAYWVSMSDGKKLETIAYFPEKYLDTPRPVLLTRTPYDMMKDYQNIMGEEFAKLGIIYIYQFCRGTGRSEGEWVPNEYERSDGIETLNWLNEQTWCKKFGVHGTSYMALTCWSVADQLPQKAVGMFVGHYGVDRYLSAYEAGLFRHDILTGWALGNCSLALKDDFYGKYIAAASHRPHIEADEKVWGIKLPWYRQWITETDHMASYWQEGFWHTLRTMPSKVNVPVCVLAGWYDHHLKGTLLAYELLLDEIKKKSSLIVGGWDHGYEMSVGGHPSKNGVMNMTKTLFDWFEPLFEGKEPLNLSKYYVIGKDEWVETDEMDTTKVKTYFFTDKVKDNRRYLSQEAILEPKVLSYVYDPNHPVKSIGGATLFVSEEIRGCKLQPELDKREDILIFETNKLRKNLTLLGKVKVELLVASDCEDTCFTIKLIDVFEDGRAYNIRNGLTTLAYRNGAIERLNYEPNKQVKIRIETLPIAWTIKKNHKIRLEISSSNFPEYAVHPNVAGVWSQIDNVAIAHQKIYLEPSGVSKLDLPIY